MVVARIEGARAGSPGAAIGELLRIRAGPKASSSWWSSQLAVRWRRAAGSDGGMGLGWVSRPEPAAV